MPKFPHLNMRGHIALLTLASTLSPPVRDRPSVALVEASPDPVAPFKWRDRGGKFHPVNKMETRHLFYTLTLIWNHTTEDLKLPGRIYDSLGAYYTSDYVMEAAKAIAAELATRKGISRDWQGKINLMKNGLGINT